MIIEIIIIIIIVVISRKKKVGRAAHFFVNLLAVNSRGLRPGSIVCSEHMID